MKTTTLLGLALCFACGSVDESPLFDAPDGGEVGQAEFRMSAPETPSYQFGSRTGSGHAKCDKTSSGQVCSVIDTKDIVYCNSFETGLNGTGQIEVENSFTAIRSALSGTGWAFNPSALGFINPTCIDNDVELYFQKAAVGASGSASSNIKDYVDVSFGLVAGLTEGSGVVGQYQRHGTCLVKLDEVDIMAKGANATEDTRYYARAIRHGIALCLGSGAAATSSTNFTNTSMPASPPPLPPTAFTAGEFCQLNSLSVGSNTQWTEPLLPCSSN